MVKRSSFALDESFGNRFEIVIVVSYRLAAGACCRGVDVEIAKRDTMQMTESAVPCIQKWLLASIGGRRMRIECVGHSGMEYSACRLDEALER